MEARLIIPTADGERLSYELRLHHGASGGEMKLVFNTSEETFERWLFYLLRDIGAHIVTDEPEQLRATLGLGAEENGIVSQDALGPIDVTRHSVKT